DHDKHRHRDRDHEQREARGEARRQARAPAHHTILRCPIRPLARTVGMLGAVQRARAHVLIVDDEPQVRATVREALEYEGYDVSEASTGAEALALLSTRRADAVVFDLWMPVMD